MCVVNFSLFPKSLVPRHKFTRSFFSLGYWPSYNVPFYEKIYNMSGYPDFVLHHGLDYSYQLAPRAKIFRREQAKVKDMTSMKAIMRYNGEFGTTFCRFNSAEDKNGLTYL